MPAVDARPTSRRRTTTTAFRSSLADDATAIINAEYGTNLQLGEVARRIATSPRSLQRALLEAGGVPFTGCLRATRMNAAAALLVRTDLSVKQIASRVGYHQQAQFAKTFRRHTGFGPTEYRTAARVGGRAYGARSAPARADRRTPADAG
jgi:AraC-like DNA-binding protein